MNDKELFEKLSYTVKHVNTVLDEALKAAAFEYCEGYKDYITKAKTEREAVTLTEKIAQENGFTALCDMSVLKPGDKVYSINGGKGIMLAIIGKEDILEGVNIVGAHLDAPRLDLKPRPLFEDSDMAWLKTQYYGGIRKYQWLALPLAMHGVICKTDGTSVDICIGEEAGEPVFTITDLLPHLAQEQSQKTLSNAFNADNFHILMGGLPKGDDEIKEKVKFNVLSMLYEKYGITEEDFTSAEIEFVPAGAARDVGLDRALVGGYAQDDRVCSYAALKALLDMQQVPEKTAICLLVDKEEIGSMGRTGMKSRFFELQLGDITAKLIGGCNIDILNKILFASECLSADVGAAYDPQYPEVFDRRNSAFAGKGVLLCKYTGGRGKSGSSDASAEFTAKVRRIFNENDVLWQNGELGKVDVGGGGTIAQYVANLGINVIDCGTALFCMHAPFEVANKFDCYMTYKAYKAFFENAK
ncbi:MAG: aminopeptidase [Clostridia bacterium]|nr:aminopeptidase [Clostridia bacterium]